VSAPKRSTQQAAAANRRVAELGADAVTGAARAAFAAKFANQVDPGKTLPAQERAARAHAAMRAHFLSLATKSVAARRRRAAAAELRALADEIDRAK